MKSDGLSEDIVPKQTLSGKVVGVMPHRHQITPLCESLSQMGLREVEVLDGAVGVKLLETWSGADCPYLFRDAEAEMVQRCFAAVHAGQVVFAAVCPEASADLAATAAKSVGALQVVYFAHSVSAGPY